MAHFVSGDLPDRRLVVGVAEGFAGDLQVYGFDEGPVEMAEGQASNLTAACAPLPVAME